MARLLMLIYEYPPIGAGAGVAARNLAECWVRQGHEVCVVTGGKTLLNAGAETDSKGVEIIRLANRRRSLHRSNPMEMLDWGLRAYSWIRKSSALDYDALFSHFILPGGIPLLALKRTSSLPCILLTHGHDIPGYDPDSMGIYHRLTRPIMQRILTHVTRLCVLTSAMKKLALEAFPDSRHKISLIPNGMDLSFYRSGYQVEEPLRLLFIGRFVAQKDPFAFLAVCRALHEHGLSFSAEMYGDGPLMAEVQKELRTKPLPNLMLHGFVGNDIIDKAMHRAHLYLHTARHEAMSISMMEAISKGLYVISTPVSGSELLDDLPTLGCRLASGSTEEFVQKIMAFFRKYQGKSFAHEESSLQSLRDQYSWDRIAHRYLAILEAD